MSMTQALPMPAQFAVFSDEGRLVSLSANDAARTAFPSLILSGGTDLPLELAQPDLGDILLQVVREGEMHELLSAADDAEAVGHVVGVRILPLDARHALILYIDRGLLPELEGRKDRGMVTSAKNGDCILYLDGDNRSVYISTFCEELSGYEAALWLDGTCSLEKILHEEDRGRFLTFQQNVVDSAVSETGEFRVRRRGGDVLWLEVSARLLSADHGETQGMMFRMRDCTARKQAEKRYELLQFSLEHSSDVIVWVRDDGSVYYVNDAACRLLDFTHEEFLMKKAWDVNRAHRPPLWEEFVAQLRELGSSTYEAVLTRIDGDIVQVEVAANYLLFEGRGYVCFFARDIGLRRRQESTLRENRERLTDALQLGNMGAFEYHVQTDALELPPDTRALLGVHPLLSTLSGENFIREFLSPRQGMQFRKAIRDIIRENNLLHVVTLELRVTGEGMKPRWMRTRLRLRDRVQDGQAVITGVTQDITDMHNAKDEEARIRRVSQTVHEQFELVFNHSLDGMCVLKDGKIFLANRAAMEMFGYSDAGQVLGSPMLKFAHPEDHERLTHYMLHRDEDSSIPDKYEFTGVRRDGSPIAVNAHVSMYFMDDEQHFMLLLRDITEQKRAEAELVAAKEQAEASDRLKDTFLATVSHEIRTPLNIIAGFASLVQSDCAGECNVNSMEYFDSIQRGIERLNRTVDLILSVSRLRSGDLRLHPAPVDLCRFVPQIVDDLRPLATQKNLHLSLEMDVESAVRTVDEYSLSKAVENLIDNAIKFTEKGSVQVRLYQKDNDSCCISIRDTGIGIAEEYFPMLFEPHSQEETGLSRRYEGIGLGLALVKEYLALNGAEIHVQSRKGEGSNFTILFPHTEQMRESTAT